MTLWINSRFAMLVLGAALAGWASGRSAHAATELGPNGEGLASDVADDSNKYLGNLYKDEAQGFQIAPPVGSRVMTRAGVELMSFVNDPKQWGGDLRLLVLKENMKIPEYAQSIVTELTRNFRGVQVLENKEQTFGKFKAGRLTVSMEKDVGNAAGDHGAPRGPTERVAVYRQDLIVRIADNQFMVLTFYTPLKDRVDADKTFQAMQKTFEIYDKLELEKRREVAMKLAKTWLAQRSAEELKGKLSNQPQIFRMRVGGRDVGYTRFDEMETERDGSKGVMVAANTRAWLQDGMAVLGKNTAYWAYSHDDSGRERQGYSVWENATKSVVKGAQFPGGKGEFWTQETGQLIDQANTHLDAATLEKLQKEREDLLKRKDLTPEQMPPAIEETQKQRRLIVSLTGDPTQPVAELTKGSIDVTIPDYRPAVLPKILEYTWTRLVDLSKPSEMTFVVYGTSSKKLTLRTLAVKGPSQVVLEGKHINCVKCTDEWDNVGTTIWVDTSGKILKMLTSDQSVLEPTTEDAMQRMWGDRARGN